MKTLLYGGLLLPILYSLLASGCSDAEKRPHDPPPHVDPAAAVVDDTLFHAPDFGEGRRLDTVMTADLDGNGRAEYIVTSIAPDTLLHAGGRADLVQIFSYDPAARRYTQVIGDTMNWASSLELRDVTGDGLPELLVPTYSGGNDLVASNGLTIFSGEGGRIRPVFQRPDGDPVLVTIEHARGEGVVVHDELWPAFAAHADAVEYRSDILAFRDEGYVSIRREQSHRFAREAESYLGEYRNARGRFMGDTIAVTGTSAPSSSPTLDGMHPLFRPAALAMLSFGTAADLRSLRSFWTSEREYLLRRLPPDQFAELDAIYTRMIAM